MQGIKIGLKINKTTKKKEWIDKEAHKRFIKYLFTHVKQEQ